jgi:hypothetical protein
MLCRQALFHTTMQSGENLIKPLYLGLLTINRLSYLRKFQRILFRKNPIGLYHPLDGITNPKYKLLLFLTTIFFCNEKKTLAFNRDSRCHLVLSLWLILFHTRALLKQDEYEPDMGMFI